ncbi:MAG: hypothetical protein WAT19_01390 [Ferruginibacter sp.]
MRTNKFNVIFILLICISAGLLWVASAKTNTPAGPAAPAPIKNSCSNKCGQKPATPLNFIANGIFHLSPV